MRASVGSHSSIGSGSITQSMTRSPASAWSTPTTSSTSSVEVHRPAQHVLTAEATEQHQVVEHAAHAGWRPGRCARRSDARRGRGSRRRPGAAIRRIRRCGAPACAGRGRRSRGGSPAPPSRPAAPHPAPPSSARARCSSAPAPRAGAHAGWRSRSEPRPRGRCRGAPTSKAPGRSDARFTSPIASPSTSSGTVSTLRSPSSQQLPEDRRRRFHRADVLDVADGAATEHLAGREACRAESARRRAPARR